MASRISTTSQNSGSRANLTADSYVGSLISLTSKSEIRYEGILFNINTEEASIGLRNVQSFGTEGRKKDGPQLPPSDKVYEYILFRGSDIKDLQVKSSTPAQPSSTANNDPAIIQSHYPRPVTASTSLPSAVAGPLPDLGGQTGVPGSNFQGGLPLYQPGGNMSSWGPAPPPTANVNGLPMPMYWQGYYGPPNGLPHMHQQSLLQPPPGLSMSPSLHQPMQYPNFNTSLPAGAPNLPPTTFQTMNLPSPNFPGSNLPNSNFPGSNLPTPNLPGSNLPTSMPSGSNLPTPILPSSNLPTSMSSGSNLPTPILPSSNKPTSNFPGSNLPTSMPSGSNLPTPILPSSNKPTSNFPGSNLPTSLPFGSNLPTSMPSGSNLPTLNLPSSNMPTSNFPCSNLPTSNFPSSNLPGLNLPTSNLPGLNLPTFLPALPSLNFPSNSFLSSTSTSLPPVTFQSTAPPVSFVTASETLLGSLSTKAPNPALSSTTLNYSLSSISPLTTSASESNPIAPPVASRPNAASAPNLPYQGTYPSSSLPIAMNSNSIPKETPTAASLVTPTQLQSGPATSSQSAPAAHKDVEVVQVPSAPSESLGLIATEAQPPLLPLPVPSRAARQPNGAPFRNRHGFRGRERGRGAGRPRDSRPITKLTADFDFEAMNEKFNKDEIWDHLGKSKSKDDDGKVSVEDDSQYEDDAEVSKAVYNKDDFFDTLSSNTNYTINRDSQNGRTRFSEQMKIDTETFGDLPRHHRGGRGGHGYNNRGGPRGGGGGGGYHGRGYGYSGRGQGRGMPNRAL